MTETTNPYLRFVQEHPDIAGRIQAIIERGRAHLENGNKAEARKEFQRALALHPHVPAALNNLALMAFADGDAEMAKAYLDDLLGFDADEPIAHALTARYWFDKGSLPLAQRAVGASIAGVLSLLGQDQASDPTRTQRSLQYVFQMLAALEADGDIIDLYEKTAGLPLLPPIQTHVGLAYFNRGRFSDALELWQQAATQGFAPARAYLDMASLLESEQLLPFRLDHLLELSPAEKERRIWLHHVPTLYLAAALTRVLRGRNDEAEDALSLLAQANLPCLERVLELVAGDLTRSERLRATACLHLFAIGAKSAGSFAQSIPGTNLHGEDKAVWALVNGLSAEAQGDPEQAAAFVAQGMKELSTGKLTNSAQAVKAMLEALAQRCGQQSESELDVAAAPVRAAYELPDAEWLRHSLAGCATEQLEKALARKQRSLIDELARRLGESAPEGMPQEALVRRLALRMRSLPLDRVLRSLSGGARALLSWLAAAESPVMLPAIQTYVGPGARDAWSLLEELYRAGLVDVGYLEEPQTVRTAENIAVVVPADLQARLAGMRRS